MPGDAPNDQTVNVDPQVQPSVGFTPEAPYEGPIGSALEYGAHLEMRAQRYKDQTAVIAANNQFEDASSQALEHPKNGLLNQNPGAGAPDLADKTLTDLQSQRSKIRAGLDNDRQRALFDRTSDEHLRMTQRRVFGWEHTQETTAEEMNFRAGLTNAQKNAVDMSDPTVPHDPVLGDPVDHSVRTQANLITDYGRNNGWTQPVIDAEVAKAKSKTYIDVVDSMLAANRHQDAQALYDAHAADIDPTERQPVLKAIKGTGEDDAAQQKLAAMLKAGDDGKPVTYADFADKLTKDEGLAKDAGLYDKVMRRGDEYFTMQEKAHRAEQAQIADTVDKALNADPHADIVKAAGSQLQFDKLDGQTQLALRSKQEQIIRGARPEKFSPDYYRLVQQSQSPGFQDVNLMAFKGKVDDDQLDELAKRQAEMSAGKLSDGWVNITTKEQHMDAALLKLGKDTSESRLDAQSMTYRSAFETAYNTTLRGTGKKALTADEMDDIDKRLVADFATTQTVKRWFGPDTQESVKQPLYQQPSGTIAGEITRQHQTEELAKPLPGTHSIKGTDLTPNGLAYWMTTLRNPSSKGYYSAHNQLQEMAQGLNEDGAYDPAMIERARLIKAALRGDANAGP